MQIRRFSSAIAILAGTATLSATVHTDAAQLIGHWDWSGENPLVNHANPGTNDAVLGGANATATGGVATVTAGTNPSDGYINLGSFESLAGSPYMRLIMNDVVIGEGTEASSPLLGAVSGSNTSTDNLFQIRVSPGISSANARFDLVIADSNGVVNTRDHNSGFNRTSPNFTQIPGFELKTGTAYDFDVEFDGTRDQSDRTAFRYRESGDDAVWSEWYYANNISNQLNPTGSLPLILGKYTTGSGTGTNATYGEIMLYTVPEPGSAVLLLIGSGLMLCRTRRSLTSTDSMDSNAGGDPCEAACIVE